MRVTKGIHWPELQDSENFDKKNLFGVIARTLNFLQRLRKTIDQRDKKIALAINAGDIEVVTSAPSAAPEYGEPVFKVYYSGATYRLYIYVDGDWRYAALT